jgi:hypothetical protein
MRFKKAQAAMEFLMTYGWAILIVLIALGAMFYLGVFSPKVPEMCSIDSPFLCEVQINSGNPASGSIGIKSSGDMISEITTITTPTGCTGAVWATGSPVVEGDSTVTLTNCGNLRKGAKFSGTFKVTYKKAGGSIYHTTNVDYKGTAT